MSVYKSYCQTEHRINDGLIRVARTSAPQQGYGPRPELRLEIMHAFLDRLGSPQRGIPAVHVAGTSGKGTVASTCAAILSAAGLRVGLHISPYLQSMTEKVQIDGRFIDPRMLCEVADEVLPIAEALLREDPPLSVHGAASVAIALEAFRRARVDAIVVEAGCGARFDLTSIVETEVAVLTNVGPDHLDVLGPSLADVAWHKAGVARSGKPLVAGTSGASLDIVHAEAGAIGARVVEVPPSSGAHVHNERLAERAARLLGEALGREIRDDDVARGLAARGLAARTEIVQEEPRVILDGAHNADKIAVAVEAALALAGPGPRVALVGLLASKASPELVRPLAGRFDAAVATEPGAIGKRPLPASETCALLERVGVEAIAEADPEAALDAAMARAGRQGTVVVLGSFYLVGALRERFYPKREVVLQGTSWPDLSR